MGLYNVMKNNIKEMLSSNIIRLLSNLFVNPVFSKLFNTTYNSA